LTVQAGGDFCQSVLLAAMVVQECQAALGAARELDGLSVQMLRCQHVAGPVDAQEGSAYVFPHILVQAMAVFAQPIFVEYQHSWCD